MSKNDVIYVVRSTTQGRYHVYHHKSVDVDVDRAEIERVIREERTRSVRQRAAALVCAHNMQRRLNTEYGVREKSI